MNLLARSALVAGTVLGLLGLYSAPALAEGEADLVVSNVTTEPGKLDFILTGPGLPDHTAIAPGGITVTADGKNLETEFKSAKTLDRTELPARGVVIVLDTSETMAGAPLAAAEVALFDYVNALSEDVAIGLVASSGATKSVVNLTYDRAAVRTAAGALAAGGSNSLNDAILLATQQFSSMVTERRIVVLAGGPEKDSAATLGEVTAAITAQQTPVDLLVYGSAKVADLETLATGSGGAIAKAETREALDPAVAVLTSKMSAPILVSAVVPVALSGRVVVVDIGVTSPAATVTTSASVSFAFDPKALPPLETARLKTIPMIILYAGMGLVGLALLIVGVGLMLVVLGRPAAKERVRLLERISGRPAAVSAEKAAAQDGSQVMRAALAVSDNLVQRQGRATIETELERAGLPLKPAEWMLVRVGCAAGGALIFAMIIPWWFVGLLIGGNVGWFGSSFYRKNRAARRARKFGDLLPDALQLVVGALRSGFSLMQALDAVVREGPEPVSSEFGRALAETRIGHEVEAALDRTAERNSSGDLSWLVMAIRIQREVGGNLSEVLETAVETMRERGRLTRHVRALSAEGRMSAYVLVGMPIAIAAWMLMVRGEYIKPLYTEPVGIIMLIAAVGMVGFGAFWISRLVKVKV